MRVSVVIPCYDMADFVAETVESVLAQTHRDVEIIAVDDGSSDGSFQVLQSFASRVRAVRQPHAGACRARNYGLSLASGEAVMFLDADDRIGPETLAALAAELEAGAPELSVAACEWRVVLEDAGKWRLARRALPQPAPGADPVVAWLAGLAIPPCALLWQRSLVVGLGGWDEDLIINQDGDLALRAFAAGARLRRAAAGLGLYRRHTTRKSVSRGTSEDHLRCKIRVLEKLYVELETSGRLERYRVPLGRAFHALASANFAAHSELARHVGRRADALAGRRAVCGSPLHCALVHLLGLERKERVAARLARHGLGRALRLEALRAGTEPGRSAKR